MNSHKPMRAQRTLDRFVRFLLEIGAIFATLLMLSWSELAPPRWSWLPSGASIGVGFALWKAAESFRKQNKGVRFGKPDDNH